MPQRNGLDRTRWDLNGNGWSPQRRRQLSHLFVYGASKNLKLEHQLPRIPPEKSPPRSVVCGAGTLDFLHGRGRLLELAAGRAASLPPMWLAVATQNHPSTAFRAPRKWEDDRPTLLQRGRVEPKKAQKRFWFSGSCHPLHTHRFQANWRLRVPTLRSVRPQW